MDDTTTRADAYRIAQYLDERATMGEPALKATLTADVGLMSPDEFEAALEKGKTELGILTECDDGIEPLL